MRPHSTTEEGGVGRVPSVVDVWCEAGGYGPVVEVQLLHGGQISVTRRLVCASGRCFVLKTPGGPNDGPQIPPDLYQREAEGLEALARAGRLKVPAVHLVRPGLLVLEDLGSAPPTATSFELAGRQLALQHRVRASRFGFDTDNYLGVIGQRNPWTGDGHAFFAEHRILRYLEIPRCVGAIPADDRIRLERLATRLPDLVPPQPGGQPPRAGMAGSDDAPSRS